MPSTSGVRGWATGQRWVRVRLYAAATLFSTFFCLLAYRAWGLQVREAQRLKEMAEDQYLRDVELPSRRGRVLDRNGAELAVSVEVDSVYANPRQLDAAVGVDAAVQQLAGPLHMDKKDLAKKLRTRRFFTWLKRRVTPEEARAVKDLNVTGVYTTREPRRYYPNRALAGLVVGWSGLDGSGLEGVELKYDKQLKGSPVEVQGLRDALGRDVLYSGLGDAPPQAGKDVVTTLDKFIQYRLEKALQDGVEQHHARAASALALDPHTGEILAMAAVPSVNPNDPTSAGGVGGGHDKGARNRPVTDPFEPGSTMKTFTLTGAIEAKVVTPDEHWFCENGKYQIGPSVIHDAERIGDATTTEVLAKSSNICTAKIARRLGKDRLDGILRRFGFGAATGVDLPGERGGLLRPSRRWGEIETATISFGQGVTATQLQLISGYAAIANGGTWYKPHVVRRVVDEKGNAVAEVAPEGHRVIDPAVAKTMQKMLHAVVDKGGTGAALAIPGYPAGGKTGTAQKVDPLTRRYSPDHWMSSFVGFAPLDDPRLIIMVTVDEPAGVHYGGSVAGPIWREVMVDALRYLNVTPSEPIPPAPAAKPDKPSDGKSDKDAPPAVAGATPSDEELDGNDGEARPAITPGDEAGDARQVPDFRGLSVGEALALGRKLRLPLDIDGSGIAVEQSPPPGPADEGTRCRVRFAPPDRADRNR